jgi:hypothetical protein
VACCKAKTVTEEMISSSQESYEFMAMIWWKGQMLMK